MVTCDLMIFKHINDIFMTHYTVETQQLCHTPFPGQFWGKTP